MVMAPKMESLFTAAVVLFGFRLGARPIGDNSMFTHLRTGIDMVATGSIPRSDPYSFTAASHRWVVQSWLPEWSYGWAHRLGGYKLVVFEQAVLVALLAWLVVRLARAGSPLRTALAGITAVGVGTALWTPRPLLFGLICMALLIAIVERRRSPWLLLPVVWLWVNSHGSFPLGLAWLGARALGEGLDWRAWPRDTLRYVGWFVAGLLVSVANPLGARLLTFPLTLGEKREAFQNIVEWRSPDFSRSGGYFALRSWAWPSCCCCEPGSGGGTSCRSPPSSSPPSPPPATSARSPSCWRRPWAVPCAALRPRPPRQRRAWEGTRA